MTRIQVFSLLLVPLLCFFTKIIMLQQPNVAWMLRIEYIMKKKNTTPTQGSVQYFLFTAKLRNQPTFICKNANTLSYYPTYMLHLCSKEPYNDNIQNCDSILFILIQDTRLYLKQFIIYSKFCEWYRAGKKSSEINSGQTQKKIPG